MVGIGLRPVHTKDDNYKANVFFYFYENSKAHITATTTVTYRNNIVKYIFRNNFFQLMNGKNKQATKLQRTLIIKLILSFITDHLFLFTSSSTK